MAISSSTLIIFGLIWLVLLYAIGKLDNAMRRKNIVRHMVIRKPD
jgi:hypothetical protein